MLAQIQMLDDWHVAMVLLIGFFLIAPFIVANSRARGLPRFIGGFQKISNDGELSYNAALAMGLNGSICALRCGWGWDEDLPLRPWPWAHLSILKSGANDLCFAWCGLFFGISWS